MFFFSCVFVTKFSRIILNITVLFCCYYCSEWFRAFGCHNCVWILLTMLRLDAASARCHFCFFFSNANISFIVSSKNNNSKKQYASIFQIDCRMYRSWNARSKRYEISKLSYSLWLLHSTTKWSSNAMPKTEHSAMQCSAFDDDHDTKQFKKWKHTNQCTTKQ